MATPTQPTPATAPTGALNKNPAAETHFVAASHHTAAAHHHLEAAHEHNQGDHNEAKEHLAAAVAHSEKAHELTTQAIQGSNKQH